MAKLMKKIGEFVGEANSLQLNDHFRQVSDSVACYTVHTTKYLYRDCCKSRLTNKEVNNENIGQLSRGGLKNLSMPLSTVVSQLFAV